MTEEATSKVTEMVDPALALEILERVDAFYNNAWSKLILFGSLLFVVVGLLWPVLVQWSQRRFFHLEEQKLRDELSEESKTEIKRLFEDESRKTGERFEENQKKLQTNFRWLASGILLVQGHGFRSALRHSDALISYMTGAIAAVDSNNESNVQTLLESAESVLSSDITRTDLDETAMDLRGEFERLVKKLEENNVDQRYTNPILKLKQAFEMAEERETNDS